MSGMCVLLLGFFAFPKIVYNLVYEVPDFVEPLVAVTQPAPTMLFVGDLMLGRHVETLIEAQGVAYPLEQVASLLESYDLTIGNFEGIVSEEHVHAPGMTFQFSIRSEYLKQLATSGFDVLSLANNHSGDYGPGALVHTRALCAEYALVCGGSSTQLDEYSLSYSTVGNKKIGFIFLHTVFRELDKTKLHELIEVLKKESDLQFAFVHWGEEYALTHEEGQEMLAHTLIDAGIDAVIGHHPHVVQDVALYKNKPIFYSLGNFVFDQYFSKDVQEGLGVGVTLKANTTEYSLLAFSSNGTRSQPHLMLPEDSKKLFSRLFQNIMTDQFVDIEQGTIVVENT